MLQKTSGYITYQWHEKIEDSAERQPSILKPPKAQIRYRADTRPRLTAIYYQNHLLPEALVLSISSCNFFRFKFQSESSGIWTRISKRQESGISQGSPS